MEAFQDMKKTYTNEHKLHNKFHVWDDVYLHIRKWKSSLILEVVPSYHPNIEGNLNCLLE